MTLDSWNMMKMPMYPRTYEAFHKWGYPLNHLFLNGVSPNKNPPLNGISPCMETLSQKITSHKIQQGIPGHSEPGVVPTPESLRGAYHGGNWRGIGMA